jgi:SagB-type dehydrogenase family enzyme
MNNKKWRDLIVPGNDENYLWELFHENTKIRPYAPFLTADEIIARMKDTAESLPLEQYPAIDLPAELTSLTRSLEETLRTRVSTRDFHPDPVSLRDLATILFYSYGVTRDNAGTDNPRPLRIVPSGGALYPLDIFFHTKCVPDLKPGLYHYNPCHNCIRLLCEADLTEQLAGTLIPMQQNLARDCSIMFLIAALFERSIFKYGARGYRFVMMEAGHVAQNLNLVTNALGLGSVNICGYYDQEVDELLGMDGLTQSTIYMIAVGSKRDAQK